LVSDFAGAMELEMALDWILLSVLHGKSTSDVDRSLHSAALSRTYSVT
jgi:hypothetical protein